MERIRIIRDLISKKVPYSVIAKTLGISKSIVAYVNSHSLLNENYTQMKSRLYDGSVEDFDAGVISLLGMTSSGNRGYEMTGKVVKIAAISFAERIGCKI